MSDQEHPQVIKSWLKNVDQEWGSPELNVAKLIPYYIEPLDKATQGMDGQEGELITIQGPSKNRKTTLWLNLAISIMEGYPVGGKKPDGFSPPPMAMMALESSMNGRMYRDAIIVNLATRILMEQGHKAGMSCPKCSSPQCREIHLYPKFLRIGQRSKAQAEAIREAVERMNAWPLYLFDSREDQGNARNLEASLLVWEEVIKDKGVRIISADHLQQYESARPMSAYEQQLYVVPRVSGIVAKHNVVFVMLSQISMSSKNAAASYGGEQMAMGGEKLKSESATVLTVNYSDDTPDEMDITLEASRWSGPFTLTQQLEKRSGTFFGRCVARNGKSDTRAGLKKDPREKRA
jgi:replicative DNA helicase